MNTLMHYHNMIMCGICTFSKWDVIFGEMLRMILGEGEKSIKPERSLAGWADTFTAGSPAIKATSEQLTSFTFTKQLSGRNISVSVAADSEKLNRLTQPHSLVIITQRNALANRLAAGSAAFTIFGTRTHILWRFIRCEASVTETTLSWAKPEHRSVNKWPHHNKLAPQHPTNSARASQRVSPACF